MDAIQKAIKEIELATYYMAERDVLRDHRIRLMEAVNALHEYRDENARLRDALERIAIIPTGDVKYSNPQKPVLIAREALKGSAECPT